MARDPTASESYVALRNALDAIRDDTSAVLSILSSLSDGGAGWVATAYYDLRRALVQGRLREAETIGGLVGVVLDAQEQGSADELAENRIHRESMQWLVDGIGAILGQDNRTGIRHLEQLTQAVYCNESLQWVAWLWTARAALDDGDLDLARQAAAAAQTLAERIDPQARGTTLCTLGEIEMLRGETADAQRHLTEASANFKEIGDGRGMATACLTLARLLVALDREEEAVEAARQAIAADPDWEEPAIFASQRALVKGRLHEAEEVLRTFKETEPRSPEVNRQCRLVDGVRRVELALPVVTEYLWFKDRPPKEEELERLAGLWQQQPQFAPVRELLAWSLLKLGKEEEAETHFQALAAQELDPEVQASVLLGLGCLASRRFGHRQSAARLRAAAAAAPQRPLREDTRPGLRMEAVAAAEAAAGAEAAAASSPATRSPSGSHPAVSAPASKAVFTGDLQLFAVPDLLEFLKSSRRTGTLVITSEGGIGAVHLKRGNITGAASPRGTNMGDLLLRTGAMTEEQMRDAAQFQREHSPDKLIGSILVEQGIVDRSTLQRALGTQIKDAIYEMIHWGSGRFAFEPDKRSQVEADEITVELDTQEVLLDALRRLDEANNPDTALADLEGGPAPEGPETTGGPEDAKKAGGVA